jgi:hypothetical protein
MAIRTEPIPINSKPNSGTIAAMAKGARPPRIKNMPSIMASIATIVTPSGRFMVESLSVFYHDSIYTNCYNLVG